MYSTTFRSWTMQGHSGASGLDTQDYAWMVEGLDPDPSLTDKDIERWAQEVIENTFDSVDGQIREKYEDREDEDAVEKRIDEAYADLESERDAIIAYLKEWNCS